MKTSDQIKKLREKIPDGHDHLYSVHMKVIGIEEELEHTRRLFLRLYKYCDWSFDGHAGPYDEFRSECDAWLAKWGLDPEKPEPLDQVEPG